MDIIAGIFWFVILGVVSAAVVGISYNWLFGNDNRWDPPNNAR